MDAIKENNSEKKGMSIGDWIWLGACVLYAISPIDLVPDTIPVAGWIDDLLIVLPGVVNAIQQNVSQSNEHLAKIIKLLKWGLIVGSVITITILVLTIVLIAKV